MQTGTRDGRCVPALRTAREVTVLATRWVFMNAPSAPALTSNVSNSSSSTSNNGGRGNEPQPKNFTPLVRQFLDYLKLERHFSDYTVKSYGADLIQFGQFLAGEIGHRPNPEVGGAPVTPDVVDDRQLKCEPLTIREFLAYLYGQHYPNSTTARKLA